jgi:D-alanyl-lipoteichoic acid acyltransferase DltB (MBOAT superfamily)
MNIEPIKIAGQLLYDEKAPLLFNSLLFLILFLIFLPLYIPLRHRVTPRNLCLLLFSVFFYYKSSGWYFLLLIATSVAAHFLTLWIYRHEGNRKRKPVFIGTVVLYLSLLIWYKYSNFFGDVAHDLGFNGWSMDDIFLPLGISFYTFELISYTTDVYLGKFRPVDSVKDFLLYISFFPHLVAGPIVRPDELLPQLQEPADIDREKTGKAVFLLLSGLLKKAVISDYIGVNFVDRVFDNPVLYSSTENLLAAYGYTLQIYCDFSGYTDMAMGIALFMGFHLPINFRQPYASLSITEFWRRWHISLSSWLRDYLYIPMGGNRKGKFRQYLNLMATMLLGGLWHGASWKFVVWGGLHGALLAMERATAGLRAPFFRQRWFRYAGALITFHLVAFCWIFFRAGDFETASKVISSVVTGPDGTMLIKVVSAYPQVFMLMLLGFVLHFIPLAADRFTERLLVRSPLIIQAVLLALMCFWVYQTKSANVQPFIYFQF